MFSRYTPESETYSSDGCDVVGIVVHSGRAERSREPRTIAFVWGGEVMPSPSLPFGRWKETARAA